MIHADVTRRMHGEVATDVVAAGELVIAARHLLDPMPRGELSYGPLHEGEMRPVNRSIDAWFSYGKRAGLLPTVTSTCATLARC